MVRIVTEPKGSGRETPGMDTNTAPNPTPFNPQDSLLPAERRQGGS